MKAIFMTILNNSKNILTLTYIIEYVKVCDTYLQMLQEGICAFLFLQARPDVACDPKIAAGKLQFAFDADNIAKLKSVSSVRERPVAF